MTAISNTEPNYINALVEAIRDKRVHIVSPVDNRIRYAVYVDQTPPKSITGFAGSIFKNIAIISPNGFRSNHGVYTIRDLRLKLDSETIEAALDILKGVSFN